MHSSATVEALRQHSEDNDNVQVFPMRDTNLRPTHTLSPSESSTMTCTSTVNLVEKSSCKKASQSTTGFSCCRRKRKSKDDIANEAGLPTHGKEPTRGTSMFMGWRLVFFGSWLNLLILNVPVTWILRLATPESHTLIFASTIVSMVPLVKMHDLSVRELAVRVGGSRTGLLNASMSNIVETVIAIIALRKCELRVVQSSLIGAMLSKLLLILGMCFFAGGMRFTQQDFDSTATQIHSSLLSLSVGAVLLPAAFHFTLSNRDGSENVKEQIEEQKKDILRMSHGVSIILIFVYICYLLFQFWSHSHHFTDAQVPSNKLPNAVSVRSMASRVRPGSPVFRKLLSPAPTFATVLGKSPRPRNPAPSPFAYQPAATVSPPRSAVTPSPCSSQSALGTSCPGAASSTVRLVPELERYAPSSPGSDNSDGKTDSPSGFYGVERGSAGERFSLVSELVSSYYTDGEHIYEVEHGEHYYRNSENTTVRSKVQLSDDARSPRDKNDHNTPLEEQKPQLSWFMTLFMMTFVTVLVAMNAEWIIDSIDSISPTMSKEWIALILLPTVGSLAECVTATTASAKDRLTLSISVAVGSTIQTALFVIPFMILLGWVWDKPLALLFDPFESIVLYISVHTMGYVVADGSSNWLEGLILIGLYVVAAVTFWFYPGSNFSANLAVCSTSTF